MAQTTTTVWELLQARLPYLVEATDKPVADTFKLEVLYTLQACLNKTAEEVEVEANYSWLELSLIADVVAIMMLWRDATKSKSASATAAETFLKKAKAGSAEAEFEQVDAKKMGSTSSSSVGINDLVIDLKAAAVNKAAKLGCVVPMLVGEVVEPMMKTFWVITDNENTYGRLE